MCRRAIELARLEASQKARDDFATEDKENEQGAGGANLTPLQRRLLSSPALKRATLQKRDSLVKKKTKKTEQIVVENEKEAFNIVPSVRHVSQAIREAQVSVSGLFFVCSDTLFLT